MNKKTDNSPETELSAAAVTDYLRRHPQFIADTPELLAALTIPHPTGSGVTSLIERQVTLLRDENRDFRHRLEALSRQQSVIEALIEQGHRLALDLLQCQHPAAVGELWSRFVGQHLDADAASLFLFVAAEPALQTTALMRVRDRHDKLRLLLVELFNRGRPLIDSLQAELLPLLFDHGVDAIHSTILLPMPGRGWDGLLALGSRRRGGYQRDQTFELLTFLAAITGLRLAQWLQPDAPG